MSRKILVSAILFGAPLFALAGHTTEHTIQQLLDQVRVLQGTISSITPSPVVQENADVGDCTEVGFTRSFGQGSSGQEVRKLQAFLVEYGYYGGPISGYYGQLTANAVKKVQAKYKLSPTGFFGPLTRSQINELIINECEAGKYLAGEEEKQNPSRSAPLTRISTSTLPGTSTASGAVIERDAKRIDDFQKIKSALDEYRKREPELTYPVLLPLIAGKSTQFEPLIKEFPTDPLTGKLYILPYQALPLGCGGYLGSVCTGYHLGTTLETPHTLLENDSDYKGEGIYGFDGTDDRPCTMAVLDRGYCLDFYVAPIGFPTKIKNVAASPIIQVIDGHLPVGEVFSGKKIFVRIAPGASARNKVLKIDCPQGVKTDPNIDGGFVCGSNIIGNYYDLVGAFLMDSEVSKAVMLEYQETVNEETNTSKKELQILSTVPRVEVITPGGGESYTTGDKISIRWKEYNIPRDAQLGVYLRDTLNPFGKTSIVTAQGGTLNDRDYLWVIPGNVIRGKYEILVRALPGPSLRQEAYDTSNSPIIIESPFINLAPRKEVLPIPKRDLHNGEMVLYRYSETAQPLADSGTATFFYRFLGNLTSVNDLKLYAYADANFSIRAYDRNPIAWSDAVTATTTQVFLTKSQDSFGLPAGKPRYFELRGTVSTRPGGTLKVQSANSEVELSYPTPSTATLATTTSYNRVSSQELATLLGGLKDSLNLASKILNSLR